MRYRLSPIWILLLLDAVSSAASKPNDKRSQLQLRALTAELVTRKVSSLSIARSQQNAYSLRQAELAQVLGEVLNTRSTVSPAKRPASTLDADAPGINYIYPIPEQGNANYSVRSSLRAAFAFDICYSSSPRS